MISFLGLQNAIGAACDTVFQFLVALSSSAPDLNCTSSVILLSGAVRRVYRRMNLEIMPRKLHP